MGYMRNTEKSNKLEGEEKKFKKKLLKLTGFHRELS